MQLKIFRRILFVLTALFFYAVSFAQANFSVSATSGCSPLFVQFTDSSGGTPVGWVWDLGNGSPPVTKQNPGVIYITPGSYTVKLTVTDANGTLSTITKTNIVTVYAKPAVAFSAQPTTGCAPLNVSFTDLSSPGSGTIQNWVWDFGDGTSSIDQNPVHAYQNTGSFSVGLFVINSFGCSQSLLKDTLIKPLDSVHADFSYTYTNICNPPSTVNFTNASTSASPLTYSWDFGNSAQSNATNPSNVYTKPGTFDVTLVATSTMGCTDTIIHSISIGSVAADFTLPAGICINEPAVMSDSSSPVAISATWDFGDGKGSSGLTVTHTYTALGIYTVTYNANFGGCTSTVTKTINVTDKPTASFSSNSVLTSCSAPLTIQFNNNSVNATSYIWDFGDGTSSTLNAPQHTYTTTGSFIVKLIAISAGGCSDTLTRAAFVRINQPKINGIVGFPYFNCAPAIVPFKATVVSPEAIAGYLWDFGDGTISTAPTPNHTYASTGTYTVTVTVTTISGCSGTYSLPSAVVLSSKPTANFSALPLNACASQNVVFNDMSTGTFNSWQWAFGDGTISTIQDPSHQYQDTGFFDVMLVVDNRGCKDTLQRQNYVYIAPPIANFSITKFCDKRYQRDFNDLSIAPQSWNWDFGDGQTNTTANPVHIYAATGTYNVQLIVKNGVCADTLTAVTQVIDENPGYSITALNTNFCKYDSIQMVATNINIANLTGIKWVFGDGSSSGFNIKNDTLLHKYSNAGAYNVKLITNDINGCYDTVLVATPVDIFGPIASFTTSKPGTCADSVFTFTDQSTSDGTFPIKNWVWDYGDGTVQTLTSPPFQHTYIDSGMFSVKLRVVDANGCYDTLLKTNAVGIGKPFGDFNILDTIRCTASSVGFKETSIGVSLTYNWDFGDGSTSTKGFPTHLYTTQGIYDVSLVVTDLYGCKDTINKPASVTISNPVASFTISDSTATCPPLPVQVTNNSTSYSSLSWVFGDGATSTMNNPFHLYTVPGVYSLQLIAQGYGACADTAFRGINLKGPYGSFQFIPISGCFPLTVSFNAVATNTITYIWDFSDGSTKSTKINNTTYTYTTPGKYVPRIILQDKSFCQVAIQSPDTITVSGVKPKFVFNAQTGCDSTLFSFTDSSSIIAFDTLVAVNWKFGDGFSSNTTNPFYYYKTPGNYIVKQTVTSAAGCTGTYSLPVNVLINQSPQLVLNIVDSACVNSSVSFKATDNSSIATPLQWQWNTGDGNIFSVQNFNYTYSIPQVYNVNLIATDSITGCADTVQQNVSVLGLPNVNAGNDTSVCLNSFATLNPSGAFSYKWAVDPTLSCTNCTNPLAMPSLTTSYFVTGTDAIGCTATDSVTVNVITPQQITLFPDSDTLCIGSSLQLNAGGAQKYSWQPPTGLSSTTIANPLASPSFSTVYTVIGSDNIGCFSDTASVSVFVAPLPTFNIFDSFVTINSGDVYPIKDSSSKDVIAWSWSPPLGLSCSDCAEPVAQPRSKTTYTAVATNSYGCSADDIIVFDVLCNNSNVYIPNTFSPNGDGNNEFFFVQGRGLYNLKSMRIYNRWGVPVFEKWNFPANNKSEGWDGKYKNIGQPSDVYVYVIDVICENGTVLTFKGNLTLIR